MALVQSQQFTGNGLGNTPRPLLRKANLSNRPAGLLLTSLPATFRFHRSIQVSMTATSGNLTGLSEEPQPQSQAKEVHARNENPESEFKSQER